MNLDLYIRQEIQYHEERQIPLDTRSYVLKHGINVLGILMEYPPYSIKDIKHPNCRDLAYVMNVILIDKYDDIQSFMADNDINEQWYRNICCGSTIPKRHTIYNLIRDEGLNPGYFWDTSPEPWIQAPHKQPVPT